MNKQAVIYARYSSDKQTEQSIEGQLRVCYEFAKAQGYDIQKEYIDRAMTGTNDNRPSFLQMINDAKNKDFQYIIVYKLDRFSRNTYDSTLYKHKLAQSGVKVISATEAISDSMEGKLIERILESMAEMYSVDLSQKVKRGMRESRLKKLTLGGFTPLGFKVVDKKLVIDEELAPHVRKIFEMYAKGSSKKEIIAYLVDNRIRSNKNNIISYNSLYKIFKNKKYIGILEYAGDIIEDYCPAIVDTELFDAVQSRLEENKRLSAKRKAEEEFILSGHLLCGYCGTHIIGDSATSKSGKKHSYYSCRAKRHFHKDCELKSINKDLLEERVISQTISNLITTKQEFINNVYTLINETTEDYRIIEYENKIKKVDKEIDDIFNQFRIAKSQVLIDKLNQQADELSELKLLYNKELKKLKKLVMIKLTKKDIEKFIDKFIDLGNSTDIEEKTKFVNTFINVIYLYNNKTYIYLNNDNEINYPIGYDDFKKDQNSINSKNADKHYYYDNNSKKCSDITASGLPEAIIYEPPEQDCLFLFRKHVTLLILNHPQY